MIETSASFAEVTLGTPDIRTYVRARGIELSHEDRALLRRKIGRKLGKFGGSIERISVRLEDVNGPRGGIDHVCRIKVVLTGLPSVVIEKRGRSPEAVAAATLAGVERAIRRRLQRRISGDGSQRVRLGSSPFTLS